MFLDGEKSSSVLISVRLIQENTEPFQNMKYVWNDRVFVNIYWLSSTETREDCGKINC